MPRSQQPPHRSHCFHSEGMSLISSQGYEEDVVFAVKRRGAHLIVLASCLVEDRSLGGTHNILVPCVSVLATSISRQFGTPPSTEIYCQPDSIRSSLLVAYPSNVRTSPLEHVLGTSQSSRYGRREIVATSGGYTYKASYCQHLLLSPLPSFDAVH